MTFKSHVLTLTDVLISSQSFTYATLSNYLNCRNTLTRETSWERPPHTEQIAQPSMDQDKVPSADEAASSSPSNEEMLQRLGAALDGDASGMMFAEEARSLR